MIGQLDALDLLTAEPVREYRLPFTVATGPGKYSASFCAYCGGTSRLNEGGAGPASIGGTGPSYHYNICEPCSDRYRHMRPPSNLWTFKEIL